MCGPRCVHSACADLLDLQPAVSLPVVSTRDVLLSLRRTFSTISRHIRRHHHGSGGPSRLYFDLVVIWAGGFGPRLCAWCSPWRSFSLSSKRPLVLSTSRGTTASPPGSTKASGGMSALPHVTQSAACSRRPHRVSTLSTCSLHHPAGSACLGPHLVSTPSPISLAVGSGALCRSFGRV